MIMGTLNLNRSVIWPMNEKPETGLSFPFPLVCLQVFVDSYIREGGYMKTPRGTRKTKFLMARQAQCIVGISY